MIIVIIILGVLFSFLGNYLMSFWHDHRIAVKNDYLYMEAKYALEAIINGSYGSGITEAYDVRVMRDGREIIDRESGNEIKLYERGEDGPRLVGRILPDPSVNPTSLLFDMDDIDGNGTERRIIPHGLLKMTEQEEPYTVEISFTKDPNRPLISIELILRQIIGSRALDAKLNSVASYLWRNEEHNELQP